MHIGATTSNQNERYLEKGVYYIHVCINFVADLLPTGGGQEPEELSLRDWQDAAAAEGEEEGEEDPAALELSLRHWDAPPAAAAEPRRHGPSPCIGADQSLAVGMLQLRTPSPWGSFAHAIGLG